MSEKHKFNDPQGIYFINPTIVFWIDLFTRKEFKHIVIESLRYYQVNKGLRVYAYCIMTSHVHFILQVEEGNRLSDVIRDFKSFPS